MISDLITTPPKRFFAFGCSFTEYFWATWANIVGVHLEMSHGTKWHNFGKKGLGNEAIANLVSQANLIYEFTEDDLVIVCWTNIARKDTFGKNPNMLRSTIKDYEWWGWGNIFSSRIYPKEELKKIQFSDLLMKNLGYIELVRSLLKNKCQAHFLQMCQVDTQFLQNPNQPTQLDSDNHIYEEIKDIYSQTIQSLYPSYYEVLWNNDIEQRRSWFDPHPLPIEHYKYLQNTFKCDWHPNLDKLVLDANIAVNRKVDTITQRKYYNGYDIIEVRDEFIPDREYLLSEGQPASQILI